MKEVVAGSCGGSDVRQRNHSFGIFIVNHNGQIILQKKSINLAGSTMYRWAPPRVPYNRFVQTPCNAAQQYLSTMELPSQLHELFTPGSPHKPSMAPIGFVIIAIASNEATDRLCAQPGI